MSSLEGKVAHVTDFRMLDTAFRPVTEMSWG